MGFVGRVEYRHVYAQTGGAQYGRGIDAGGDLLWLSAEAFERDADPADFSLRAMIAHERGHQLLARHPRLAARRVELSTVVEEVLASLIGAWVAGPGLDRDSLIDKAAADLLDTGATAEVAARHIEQWWGLLEELL